MKSPSVVFICECGHSVSMSWVVHCPLQATACSMLAKPLKGMS